MTNGLIFAVYLTLAITTLVMIVVAVMQNRSQRVVRDFVLLCVFVLGWQVAEIAYTLCTNPFGILWLFDLKLPFVAFSAVFLLRFTLRFFRMEAFLGKGLLAVLSVVPAITAVLSLTSPWHHLIRQQLELLQTEPMHVVLNQRGSWFWVHTAYSYVLLLLVAVIVLVNHHKLPRAYRMPSSMMALGVACTLASNLLVLTAFSSLPFDFTLVGMTVALVFVYIGVSLSKQADFLMLARTEIFNYLDDHVFILDNSQRIIDANLSARRWMEQIGVPGEMGSAGFGEITARLTAAGVGGEEEAGEGEEETPYLSDPGGQVVYRLRRRAVLDRTGRQIGLIATLTDVTRYKMLIDHLEITAGVDPLTGLGNRRSYLLEKEKLDDGRHLPLSILLGDVNGLKEVNDNLGHQQGDALLRVTASMLIQACPSRARVFRIGGDEFVVLLPHTPAAEARELILRVQQMFAGREDLPFRPSIALGGATKERQDQDYDALLRDADRAMYASKRNDRRTGLPDRRRCDIPLPPGMQDRRKGPRDQRQLPDRRVGPQDRREGNMAQLLEDRDLYQP